MRLRVGNLIGVFYWAHVLRNNDTDWRRLRRKRRRCFVVVGGGDDDDDDNDQYENKVKQCRVSAYDIKAHKITYSTVDM